MGLGTGRRGFPSWKKWRIMRDNVLAKPGEAYVVCNADEGDPGAYMNRNEIESDPHMLLEGIIIGAYAMGATKGIVYVRAEYPLAVERFTKALGQARSAGLLGKTYLVASLTSILKSSPERAPLSAARKRP